MAVALDWKAVYSMRRSHARQDLASRRRKIFAESAELAAWFGRYTQAQKALGMAVAGRDEAGEQRCRQEIVSLEQEKRSLLLAAGYSAQALDLEYTCPECRDYGRVNGRECSCLQKLRREYELDGWDESQSFARYDLGVFSDENGQRSQMERLRKIGEDYADGFPENEPPGMFIRGRAGLGKTFILNCIGRRILERGFRVRRITDYQFHQMLMERVFKGDNESYYALVKADLLVYDDLGAAPKTQRDIAENYFFALLDERCKQKKPMIVGTNYTMGEIDGVYGERCSSRLLDKQSFRGFLLKGEDLRLRRD